MSWDTLLTTERYHVPGTVKPPSDHSSKAFQEDAERIIYSSPFRRLQGKTQVHPLPAFDYLRTRLTHTVEVAHIGRIIATECARLMIQQGDIVDPIVFGDIVYAASLAHDVGNPPFGHIGEYAIQTWFLRSTLPTVRDVIGDGKSAQAKDFLHFDGNAQGFRILTSLSGWRGLGGLQLTCATLGAFSKYPFSSTYASSSKPKYGFSQADEEAAKQVYEKVGMMQEGESKWHRHPLAYIVEAADDISYLTTDIEDAFRVGMLLFTSAEPLLKSIADMGLHLDGYARLANSSAQDQIAYLRSRAVLSLAEAAVVAWTKNRQSMLAGTFSGDLLSNSTLSHNVDEIRSICRSTVYKELKKLQTEAAGYHMIMSLMDLFGGMIDQMLTLKPGEELDMRNAGLYELLPKEFRSELTRTDPYRAYLVLVDYIAGMTDRFALETFQRFTGASASLGRML